MALTLGARVWLSHWVVTDQGPSGGGSGYWAEDPDLELLWMPVVQGDGRTALVPYLHWSAPADADGWVPEHYERPEDSGDGRTLETIWAGRTARGYAGGLQLDAPPLLPPEEGQPRRVPIRRLLWHGWGVPDLPDPEPYDHSYDAQIPAGELVLRADPGTLSTGSHLDHPRAQDGAALTLGSVTLPCTSWAVLARREGDGPDAAGTPGLLTCDGTRLRAWWGAADDSPAEVDVTLLLGLRDVRGDPLPAGTVQDALLESELAVYRHPDHVRLLYTLAGKRRAVILAPWNAWRDLDKAGWAKAGRTRPRTLAAWLKLPRPRWPAPPPHGLAYQGQITPPLLDAAGLPRYGLSPEVYRGPDPLNLRWPWGDRTWLDLPDERAEAKPRRMGAEPLPTGWPDLAGPVVIVGRGTGDAALKRAGGHWAAPARSGAVGLRPFVLTRSGLPPALDLRGLNVQHLAAYRLYIPGDAN